VAWPDPARGWSSAIPESSFASFKDWAAKYQAAGTAEEKKALEAEGVVLATARRTALAQLIQRDPKRALELAVPDNVREAMPPVVGALLEERVTDRGDLQVLGVRQLPGTDHALPAVARAAIVHGETYEVFTYGAGNTFLSKRDVPLNGIAVATEAAASPPSHSLFTAQKLMALSPDPARILAYNQLQEALAKEPICSVSGKPTEVAVQLGTEIKSFCGHVHADDWAHAGIAASGVAAPSNLPPIEESTLTEGRKRMLLMRPIWSDYTGGMTTNDALTHFQNFSNYMYEMSYGKLVLAPLGKGSDITPSMTLPGLVAEYDNTGLGKLYTTCLNVAQSSYGYDLAKYDYTYVCTAGRPAADYAGLAFVGGVGFHLANSYWDAATACHEFGHNLGLNHAHFWDTDLKSVIGDGVNVEYGDRNDPMGGGGSPNSYNSRYKNYLGWIVESDVADLNVLGSGQYRLYAFDLDNSSGLRGLKFRRNASQNYWIESRQRKTGNKALQNGVQLLWTGNGNEGSYLLDVRLKGNSDNNAIVIGQTFSDLGLNLHVTPLRLGHTLPESIDVRVNVGPFPANLPPTVLAGVDLPNAAVSQVVTFTAVASDPNGDPLAYAWNFGDGDFSIDNSAVTTHAFAAGGEYNVHCVVSDMKGGTAGATLLVRAGATPTFRISGRVFDGQNRPLRGMRVSTDTGKYALTDNDGTYTIAGLAAGSYGVDAIEPTAGSYAFVHPAFSSPVVVSANVAAIDLIGVPTSQTVSTALVPRTAAGWKYNDTGADLGTAWRPLGYDDSFWAVGAAPLGYPAGLPAIAPVATVIGFGGNPANKFITYYFRKSFTVADPSSFTSVVLDVLRDDGIVVYVNGTEAYRNNMPGGTITASTTASSRIDAGNYLQATVNRGLLVSGNNQISAEVHQGSVDSSDVVFDAALSGLSISGLSSLSMLYLTSPADQARFTAPASIPLTVSAFSANATFTLVEFYVDGGKIGEDAVAPFGLNWPAPPVGSHRLTVVGTLSTGGQITSPAVSVDVLAPAVPSIAITSPTNGAAVFIPSNLVVRAAVAAAGVAITTVQLYQDGTFIEEDLTAPYAINLPAQVPGPHALVAVAVGANGLSYTSAPVVLNAVQPSSGTQLVSFGEVWKYFDDGIDPGPDWMKPTYDDRGWSAGPGRLGFGGDGEVTVVNGGSGSTRRLSIYFRKRFNVPNPALFSQLLLRLMRDDGAIVYLNGVEVLRDNMLSGVVSWNSLAVNPIDGAAETLPVDAFFSPAQFLSGTNLLAVEIHQVNLASTDLGFDLSLLGLNAALPTADLYLFQPCEGAQFNIPAGVPLASFASSSIVPGSVTYYADGTLVGAGAASPPYGLGWSNGPVGAHALTAVGTTAGGLTVTSAPVHVSINPRPAFVQPFSTTIIAAGTTWKYWDNLNPVGGGWVSPGFDDTSWPAGPGRFGWGLDGERTVLTTGRQTTYFRRWFNFPFPGQVGELEFQLVRDDGAVVYLNGVELFRQNMPAGPITASTFALSGVNPPDETTFFRSILASSGSGLLLGSNLVAVELHQAAAADADASFDLQLLLNGTTEARVYLTTPIEGTSYTSGNPVISLEAQARASGGNVVTNIEFFADGLKLGELSAAPWKLDWHGAIVGPHTLTARSHDSAGVIVDSPELHIAVGRTLINNTLFTLGATWKYMVTGVALPASWISPSFNDAAWPSGQARLGYGGDGEVTLLGYGGNAANKYITTYFRKNVVVTDGAVYTNLTFRLVRDDGAVVYLNGRELFRSNMPSTPIAYGTLASTSVGGADEQAIFVTSVGTTNFHTGTNVIAVEMHQAAPDSSDLGFNLELVASGYLDEAVPPTLFIAEVDGAIEFTWLNTAVGYRVYESPDVTIPPSAWTLTGGSLVELPGRFVYTVPKPPANRFYRLIKQ
jgi:hypothetical protein